MENLNKFILPENDEIATLENVAQFTSNFLNFYGQDGENWRELREGICKFAIKELEHGGPDGPYLYREMGSRIRDFYSGYMACNDLCCKKITESRWIKIKLN